MQRESIDVRTSALLHAHDLDVAPAARSSQRASCTLPHHCHLAQRSRHARQLHRTVVIHRSDLVDLDFAAATLLILRIDRRLEWDEIARIVDGDATTPEQVKRASATLRKRFERVKARLRELSEGMLADE